MAALYTAVVVELSDTPVPHPHATALARFLGAYTKDIKDEVMLLGTTLIEAQRADFPLFAASLGGAIARGINLPTELHAASRVDAQSEREGAGSSAE